MISGKFLLCLVIGTVAVTSVHGIQCYTCFYCANETLAAELAPGYGLGDSRADCEVNPGEDTLVDYGVANTLSGSLLHHKFNVKITPDHCMKAAGTVNNDTVVRRTAIYFEEDRNGTCLDLEANGPGYHIIERDCYCTGDACNDF